MLSVPGIMITRTAILCESIPTGAENPLIRSDFEVLWLDVTKVSNLIRKNSINSDSAGNKNVCDLNYLVHPNVMFYHITGD